MCTGSETSSEVSGSRSLRRATPFVAYTATLQHEARSAAIQWDPTHLSVNEKLHQGPSSKAKYTATYHLALGKRGEQGQRAEVTSKDRDEQERGSSILPRLPFLHKGYYAIFKK